MSTSSISNDGSWIVSIMRKKRKKIAGKKDKGPPRPSDDVCIPYCLTGIFVLFIAIALIVISIWSFLRKFPYYMLLEVRVDLPYFILPAGILSLPCFWITYLMKKNFIYRQRLVHLLVTLQLITVSLLITGVSIGMVYVSKLDQGKGNLTTSLQLEEINASLQASLLESQTDSSLRDAWDKTQIQLKCCGIISYHDWIKLENTIPNSCCSVPECTSDNVYIGGCLDSLSVDLQWQSNFTSSHCFMGSVIHIVSALCAIAIYMAHKIGFR